jgi:hypothetical protein
MMPSWVWWGLIAISVFAVGWLYGRRGRPREPAGHAPWENSWAVYFSPNGGATGAILEVIRNARQIILVQAYLLYSTRVAGALVRAHQRGVQVHVILDATAQPHDPPVRPSHAWWRLGSLYSLMRSIHGHTIKSWSWIGRSSSRAPITGRLLQNRRTARTYC